MPPHEFDFKRQLLMSQGHATNTDVHDILLAMLPGAVSARSGAPANDRRGVDWWVELATAHHLAVDVKVREKDFAPRGDDDLALETWSVCPDEHERGVIGWTRDSSKRCDYVLWLWQDTGRYCLLPFLPLCKVFTTNWRDWRASFRHARQKTVSRGRGYHSECVFVPRIDVWRAIYNEFGASTTIHQRAAA
jgi:hypothetical protein